MINTILQFLDDRTATLILFSLMILTNLSFGVFIIAALIMKFAFKVKGLKTYLFCALIPVCFLLLTVSVFILRVERTSMATDRLELSHSAEGSVSEEPGNKEMIVDTILEFATGQKGAMLQHSMVVLSLLILVVVVLAAVIMKFTEVRGLKPYLLCGTVPVLAIGVTTAIYNFRFAADFINEAPQFQSLHAEASELKTTDDADPTHLLHFFVMDKSGSMLKDNKSRLAAAAVIATIDKLQDEDLIGILAFDQKPFLVLRPDKVGRSKKSAVHRLKQLVSMGKDNIPLALNFARQQIEASAAKRSQIILITDSWKFKLSKQLEEELHAFNTAAVKIHVLQLPPGRPNAMLPLAEQTGGKYFFLDSATAIAHALNQIDTSH